MKSAEFDVNNLLEDDDADLKEELQASQHFLFDSELEKGKHPVFNFAMSTFENSLINRKLDLVFRRLKCVAKVNLAFGSCRYFLLTRTILLWRGRNLCVHQTTLPT